MVSNYIFRKYKDKYYLSNSGITNLTYRLDLKDMRSDAYILIISGTVIPSIELEIPFITEGLYRLTVDRPGANPIEHTELTVRYYLNLQKELIYNTVKTLCTDDCGCSNCGDSEECRNQQALFNQLLTYQFIAKPYAINYINSNTLFERFLQEALNQNKAYLSDAVYQDILKQLETGKVESTSETLGIFASIYLCSFYFYEKMQAVDDSERLYVSDKFNWPRVSDCMKKYIPFSNLEDIFIELSDLCPPLDQFMTKDDFDFLQAEIDILKSRITITEGQISLAVTKTEFDALGNRVSLAESSIIQNANQIALRVTLTDFNALGNRVSLAESSIIQNAQQIALRVTQTDFNALGQRVGIAESSIIQNANQIALKVSQIEFDALGNRVTTAESSIIQNANQIQLKVSQTEFNTLKERVGIAESSITQNANQIALKVSQTDFDSLGNRVGIAESSIVQNANQIALKVSQVDFNALGLRVGAAESAITQNANQIQLRVTQTDFNTLGDRVGAAEASITINATQIASKVSQTSFDSLGGRVSTAESNITQNANNINLKVSLTDYTGANLVSMINLQPDSIKIQSKNIDIDGSVVFSSLNSPTITINKDVNGVPDRALKIYHNNGIVGILMTTDPVSGLANISAYNNAGTKTWDLNSVTGYTYVTVVPESWITLKFLNMQNTNTTPTEIDQSTMKNLIRSNVSGVSGGREVIINPDTTGYQYNNGTNPDSAANAPYNGVHTAQIKATDNFLANGWYCVARSSSVYEGKFSALIQYFTAGLQTSSMYLYEIPYNGDV